MLPDKDNDELLNDLRQKYEYIAKRFEDLNINVEEKC